VNAGSCEEALRTMEASAVEESAASAGAPAGKDELFGHPRGLGFLFGTEMWERFSYYGMRSLLVLYMVKHLLHPGAAEEVVGLAGLRHALEAVFGPLDVQPFASQIYGFYTGLVYLTPIFGGLLADRVLGHRRTVIIGALLMAAGHFMMAFEPLFLFALLFLILGNGAFKPNMSTQVGELYAPGDPRRDRAYSIFYVGINVGAFLAPYVCGTLGEKVSWDYGFAAAGIGMLIALTIYLAGASHLPPDPLFVERAARKAHAPNVGKPLTADEWRSVAALIILFLPVSLFWATYEQQGNTIALWIDTDTDRTINLLFGTFEIPTTWFQSFNPAMIFAFTPFVVALWTRQARRGSEPSTTLKMSFGCALCGLSYLILMAAALHAGDNKASWLWLFVYFVIITTGELYLSPIGLSLVSKIAPRGHLAMMMGMWLGTSFVGNFLAGYLGSFWSSMTKPMFFLMLAAISLGAAVAIFALDRPLRGALMRNR
jgi:proton-dependent oligopeptide transporter, POT family